MSYPVSDPAELPPPPTDDDVEPILFYLVATCQHCDADMHYGLCASTLVHRGRPAVSLSMVEQVTFHCPECGAANYTGDVDMCTEGGEP